MASHESAGENPKDKTGEAESPKPLRPFEHKEPLIIDDDMVVDEKDLRERTLLNAPF
jgi:hypothetical protein